MLLGTSDDKAIICNDGSSHQQNNARQNETIHLCDLLVILCFCILFLCNTFYLSTTPHTCSFMSCPVLPEGLLEILFIR